MPKLLPIQHTFDAGEISPRMLARSDLGIFSRGVSLASNAVLSSQGSARTRGGTTYFAGVTGTTGRVFGFQDTWDAGYEVVISDNGNIYVSDIINTALGSELVSNGNFNSGLADWIVFEDDGTVTVVDNFLTLTSASHKTFGIVYAYQSLVTASPGEEHNILVQMLDPGISVEVRIGTAINTSDIALYEEDGTLIAATFTPPSSPFWVTIWKDGGVVETKRVDRISIKPVIEVTDPPPPVAISSFPHPWTNNFEWIHAKMPPGENAMYFTHPNFPPQILSHDDVGVWSFGDIPFVGQPEVWTGTSYPRCMAFYQGRSWWGGPEEIFYGSKSGSLIDLTTGTEASDGIAFAVNKRGEIVWMEGVRNLVMGTRTGEHIITSESGIITPSDIDVEQQSAYGSNHCQPVQLGSKIAYVTADGKKIQDIGYQWTAEQWLSTELNFSAEHLTRSSVIEEIFWAQNPDKILGCKLTDGSVLLCLYDPTKEIIGWSTVSTEGFVHSLDKIDINGISYFIGIISRGINNELDEPLMYLEIFGSQSYLDSSGIEFSETPKNTIDDAIYLAGKTVSVKIDDAVHPPVVLSAEGTATLQWSGNEIVYGLPFSFKLNLLPRDMILQGGSTTSFKRRWNKVWVRVLGSVLPEINGKLSASDRHPQTPMNQAEGSITTDIQVSTLGFNRGEIYISSNIPYSVEVLGVFGEMAAEKV